jgi:hypothetical protein
MTIRTIHLDTEYKTAIRFPSWLALMVFSIICLASMVAQTDPEDRRSEDQWALAVAAMSICISFSAVCGYLCVRSLFIAQVPEVAMVRLIRSLLKQNNAYMISFYTLLEPEHGRNIAYCRLPTWCNSRTVLLFVFFL